MTDRATHWHEAFAGCPCGCEHDADYLIEDETGVPIAWQCHLSGDSGTVTPPARGEKAGHA